MVIHYLHFGCQRVPEVSLLGSLWFYKTHTKIKQLYVKNVLKRHSYVLTGLNVTDLLLTSKETEILASPWSFWARTLNVPASSGSILFRVSVVWKMLPSWSVVIVTLSDGVISAFSLDQWIWGCGLATTVASNVTVSLREAVWNLGFWVKAGAINSSSSTSSEAKKNFQ